MYKLILHFVWRCRKGGGGIIIIMKKLGILLGVFAVAAIAFADAPSVSAASAAPTYYPTGNTVGTFVANGTPITISEDETTGNTIVTWSEHGGVSSNGLCDSPCEIKDGGYIIGGYNGNSESTTTSITMTGGVVYIIVAGGYVTGATPTYVTSADVNITGGTITGYVIGGGVGNGSVAGGGNLASASDRSTAANVVDSVTIDIGPNVTTIKSGTYAAGNDLPIVYAGGGNGYTYVGTSNVFVNGGDWARLIAGGTSGFTNSATIAMLGGNADIIQGLNRGTTNASQIDVVDGTVGTIYAGADVVSSPNGRVLGTVNQSVINITGGSVDLAHTGYVSSGDLDQSNTQLTYLYGTLDATEGFDLTDPNVKIYIPVTIDGASFAIEEGKTLADYDLNGIRVRDGYTFKGFIDAAGNVFSESTAINSPVTLTTSFVKNTEANPDTSDSIVTFALLGMIGVFGIAGSMILVNKK